MSVLIYRGVLAIMRCDRDKPTVDDAVNKTVKYLEKALKIYASRYDVRNEGRKNIVRTK